MKVTRFIIASAFFFDSIHCQADQAQEAFLDLLSRLSGREIVTKLDFDDELKVEMRGYGWQVAAEGSLNPKGCWLALTLLGDSQARPLVVTEITKDPTSILGSELAASGVPTLLLDLAPVMFRKERWENLGKGSDAGYYPASFEMATLIVRLLGRSPYLNAAVINWARRFGDRPEVYEPVRANETRDIMREWWQENEDPFRHGNYSEVKPGRDPTPFPEPQAPVSVSVVASEPTASSANSATSGIAKSTERLADPASSASERRTVLWPWLAGGVGLIVLGALIWKRHSLSGATRPW